MFGSYAKGLATGNSDIDIVIDSNGESLNIHFYGLLEQIIEKLNKNVDLFEISEIKKGSPIFEEIHKEGVLLYAIGMSKSRRRPPRACGRTPPQRGIGERTPEVCQNSPPGRGVT